MKLPPHHARTGRLELRQGIRRLTCAACLAATVSLSAETADNWRPLPKSSRHSAPDTTSRKGAVALVETPATDNSSARAEASKPKPRPVLVTYNTVEEPASTNAPAPANPTPTPPAAAAATASPAATPAAPPASTPDTVPAAAGAVANPSPAPVPAPVSTPPVTAPAIPTPTQTPITTKVGGKQLYSFKAENLELKSALAIFARANKLNIVPDQEVTGQITLDLEDLPLDRVMQALLEAYDYTWVEQDGLIRVRGKQTQEFQVDYLRLSRKGSGMSSAMLASGMSGGSGGSGGGGGAASGGSSVNLTGENNISFWTELKTEIEKLLTSEGKENIAINQTAGVIQITDRPSALKRVGRYLSCLGERVSKQVEIQARIFDVTLRDQFQFGIDWEHAASAFGGAVTVAGNPTVGAMSGGQDLKKEAFKFMFKDENTQVLLTALKEQGEVNVVSQPRIRVLNNQTAMIKVGTETPFFKSRSITLPGQSAGTTSQSQEDEVTTITVGTILAITPQISSNEWVTLDIAPVLSSLVETKISPSELTTAPVLDIKQASTLVRVQAGTTIIIGGLMQDEKGKTVRTIPWLGDIPLLGKLFQGQADYKIKKELVISITPTITQ